MSAPTLLIVVMIYGGLAALYAWAVPPLEGFDSLAHQNYLNFLRQTGQLPTMDPNTALYSYQLVQQPPLYYLLSATLTLPFAYADWHTYVDAAQNVYFPTLSPRWTIHLPEIGASTHRGYVVSLLATRSVALLGGLTAVAGAWYWARMMFFPPPAATQAATQAHAHSPAHPQALLLVVVLLFALNPLFLFVSVTVSNDSWAIAGAVWVMALATRLAQNPRARWQSWAGLGLVAGAAALVKYNVLVMALPVGVILLFAYWQTPARLLRGSVIAVSCALAVAGFWYGRNLMQYGELIPLQTLARVIPTIQRETPPQWSESLGWLFHSYWGVFVAVFAPAPFYTFWQIFVVVGCVGLAVVLVRHKGLHQRATLAKALLWITTVAVALWFWSRTVAYGEQARLLLIAGPAIALLLGLGWHALIPPRMDRPFLYALSGMIVVVALWPLPTLRDIHALPQSVNIEEVAATAATYQPVGLTFAPGMTLVGYDLPHGRAFIPGSTLPLDLYWTADAPIEQDYTLFVHIADAQDRMWYHHDGVPASGRHPTRQWLPREVFAMRLELSAEGDSGAELFQTSDGGLGTLSVGFYPHAQPETRVPLAMVQPGETLFDTPLDTPLDRLILAELRWEEPIPSGEDHAAAGATGMPLPLAVWEGGIHLLSAKSAQSDEPPQLQLELEWETTELLTDDWTVFVHLIDSSGALVAQKDRSPLHGDAPTSTWLPGAPIGDTYWLALPAPLPDQKSYALHIGWYNVETGARLPRLAPDLQDAGDFVAIPLEK